MCTIARSGSFNISRNVNFFTFINKCQNILLPILLIKIERKKKACFILKKRVKSYCFFPTQMIIKYLIGEWRKLTILAFRTFYQWFLANRIFAILNHTQSLTALTILRLPTVSKHIHSAFKQTFKEVDFLLR